MYRYHRENGHDQFLARAEEAQRYWASEQWTRADALARRDEERPMVTVNEVFNTINSIVGEMDQLSTDVRYSADTGDEQTAQVLNKLSEHVDRQNKVYLHDQRVKFDGLLTGRGFFEIRMDFDDNLQGNIKLTSRRPQNVILDCGIDSIDPNEWARVMTTDVLSLQDVENLYGAARAREMKGAPIADWFDVADRTLAENLGYNQAFHRPEGTLDATNPYIKQYRQISEQYFELRHKEFFVDLGTGDMSEIPENWPREKVQYALDNFNLGTTRRKAKTLRWRVVVNDSVVHDEDSPYQFFTIVPFLPYFLDGATQSLFDVIKGPQDLLNKALSEEIHIMTSAANSGWRIKANSLKNMTPRALEKKGSKNGLVMVLDDVEDAKRIEPSNPPNGFQSLSDRAQGWTKALGGVTPSMMGNQRADAAGEGIRMQLMRAPVNLSVPLTAFHFAKHLLAERKLNLFQTYYTETRVMRVTTGPYGTPEEIGINMPVADRIANDLTVGKYSAYILPTGSRMQAEEYAFDELVQLRELGIKVPNSLFLAVSSINAKADAIEQLRAANNGELSPEEERAQQLEMEQLEAQLMDTLEGIEAKKAQKILNLARARKNMSDAQYDPRQDRNALDRDRLMLEHQRGVKQLNLQESAKASDTAVALLELEQKAKSDAQKPTGTPPKKAATKKVKKNAAAKR